MSEVQESALKKQIMKSAEKMAEAAFDEIIAIAEAYAKDSASPIDDSVVSAVKLVKESFLDDLIDKIDGEEG